MVDTSRLELLLDLVSREDVHLLAVRERLLGDDYRVTPARMRSIVADAAGVDRLESFGAKFARMQDTVADKLLPTILRGAGENVGAAIDNLDRAARIGLIADSEAWLEMRGLRNRLVHEYFDRPEDMAPALEKAAQFTDDMHRDFASLRQFARSRVGVRSVYDNGA